MTQRVLSFPGNEPKIARTETSDYFSSLTGAGT